MSETQEENKDNNIPNGLYSRSMDPDTSVTLSQMWDTLPTSIRVAITSLVITIALGSCVIRPQSFPLKEELPESPKVNDMLPLQYPGDSIIAVAQLFNQIHDAKISISGKEITLKDLAIQDLLNGTNSELARITIELPNVDPNKVISGIHLFPESKIPPFSGRPLDSFLKTFNGTTTLVHLFIDTIGNVQYTASIQDNNGNVLTQHTSLNELPRDAIERTMGAYFETQQAIPIDVFLAEDDSIQQFTLAKVRQGLYQASNDSQTFSFSGSLREVQADLINRDVIEGLGWSSEISTDLPSHISIPIINQSKVLLNNLMQTVVQTYNPSVSRRSINIVNTNGDLFVINLVDVELNTVEGKYTFTFPAQFNNFGVFTGLRNLSTGVRFTNNDGVTTVLL